jgi:hypothetical protein
VAGNALIGTVNFDNCDHCLSLFEQDFGCELGDTIVNYRYTINN